MSKVKTKRAPSAYNLFVKEQMPKLRKQYPGLDQHEYMILVGEVWRDKKGGKTVAKRAGSKTVVKKAPVKKAPVKKVPLSAYDLFVKKQMPKLRKQYPGLDDHEYVIIADELWSDKNASKKVPVKKAPVKKVSVKKAPAKKVTKKIPAKKISKKKVIEIEEENEDVIIPKKLSAIRKQKEAPIRNLFGDIAGYEQINNLPKAPKKMSAPKMRKQRKAPERNLFGNIPGYKQINKSTGVPNLFSGIKFPPNTAMDPSIIKIKPPLQLSMQNPVNPNTRQIHVKSPDVMEYRKQLEDKPKPRSLAELMAGRRQNEDKFANRRPVNY